MEVIRLQTAGAIHDGPWILPWMSCFLARSPKPLPGHSHPSQSQQQSTHQTRETNHARVLQTGQGRPRQEIQGHPLRRGASRAADAVFGFGGGGTVYDVRGNALTDLLVNIMLNT